MKEIVKRRGGVLYILLQKMNKKSPYCMNPTATIMFAMFGGED